MKITDNMENPDESPSTISSRFLLEVVLKWPKNVQRVRLLHESFIVHVIKI